MSLLQNIFSTSTEIRRKRNKILLIISFFLLPGVIVKTVDFKNIPRFLESYGDLSINILAGMLFFFAFDVIVRSLSEWHGKEKVYKYSHFIDELNIVAKSNRNEEIIILNTFLKVFTRPKQRLKQDNEDYKKNVVNLKMK